MWPRMERCVHFIGEPHTDLQRLHYFSKASICSYKAQEFI